jgi:hypothetical protein
VQAVVVILLFAVLAVAMAASAVLGLVQARRARALARAAHEAGFKFSPSDPFDVPRRYAGLALISSGHSPRASNVTHGRLKGLPVRAFDFTYEIGHGPRRVTRHYSVVVAETDRRLPPAIIWHVDDGEMSPLPARQPTARVGCWLCSGDEQFSRRLAEACRPVADQAVSAQTWETRVMLCAPVPRGSNRRAFSIVQAGSVLSEIDTWASRTG